MSRLISSTPLADTMVRIGVATGIPAALQSLGLDPKEVLRDGGFDLDIFDNPDNLISFSARSRLMAHCAARANCPHFGLLAGSHSGLRSLGLLGLLVQHSPDVKTAVQHLLRLFYLQSHGATLTLKVENNIAIFAYHITHTKTRSNGLVGTGAVAIMYNILRELCGPNWQAREVWFIQGQPKDAHPYHQFFQSHLQFNAEQNAIVFLSSWLNRPLQNPHPDLYKLAQQQINNIAGATDNDFPELVRQVLRASILRGAGTVDKVASLFSMHSRTLHRRLKAHNTSFQLLFDQCGMEIAQHLLEDTKLSIAEIALRLHYADARSFIRAFRRWSHTTPAQWRVMRTVVPT